MTDLAARIEAMEEGDSISTQHEGEMVAVVKCNGDLYRFQMSVQLGAITTDMKRVELRDGVLVEAPLEHDEMLNPRVHETPADRASFKHG